jgi:hypothetical protein
MATSRCLPQPGIPVPFASICYEWVTSRHVPNMVMLQLCVVLYKDSLLWTLSLIIHKSDERTALIPSNPSALIDHVVTLRRTMEVLTNMLLQQRLITEKVKHLMIAIRLTRVLWTPLNHRDHTYLADVPWHKHQIENCSHEFSSPNVDGGVVA